MDTGDATPCPACGAEQADLARLREENADLRAALREVGLRDPLTGLHNRAFLYEALPAFLARSLREREPLAVALLDLDHLGAVNADHGSAFGDVVIERFAMLLAATMRRSDLVCRVHGGLFAAVLPDVDGEGAMALLARLLVAFRSEPIDVADTTLPPRTFSAGVALFPRHGPDAHRLVSHAETALRAAKQRGRARVELAPGSPTRSAR